MITKLLVILLSVLGLALAAPPASTSFDQRQDGEVNVKVDLDNFLILVARPASGLDLFGSMAQLFVDAKRNSAAAELSAAEPAPTATDLNEQQQQDQPKIAPEDAAIVAAEKQQSSSDEEPLLLVQVQEGDKAARSLEDIVRNLRKLKDKQAAAAAAAAAADKEKPGKYKFVESVEEPQSLKLIGDAVENCGPGRSRDRSGICQGDGLALQDD